MAKSPYTPEWKITIIKKYLSGEGSYERLEEAAAYFNIGMGKIRELSNTEDCPFVLWVGSKRMIKRKKMEAFLDGAYSI